MLLICIFAFSPILAAGIVLDGYVRSQETARLTHAVDNIASEAQTAVYEAIQAMDDVLNAAPSLCTRSFLDSVSRRMQKSIFIRQVLVENNQGVRYCEALGGQIEYDILSDELVVPGRNETVAAVRIPGVSIPGLRVTRQIGANKHISAFVTSGSSFSADQLPVGMENASMLRVSFSDGTSLFTVGDSKGFDDPQKRRQLISAVAFSGDVPIRVEVAAPFEKSRGSYGDLYFWIVLSACAFSAMVLALALRAVRNFNLPTFDLRQAISVGEIRPFYQPVIDVTTGQVYGCEVLARWVKPSGEIISPAAFIEYAEVTGLAIPMTISLMESVRQDLQDISAEYPDLRISINLFEGHFRDGSVVDDVVAIFGDSKISYQQLVFEITERFPLEEGAQTISVMSGLHALGCRLALDDVGTGHSNLAYIQTLGVDIIKIDKVFVDPIGENTQSSPILDSLINMSLELDAGIIAEGVETEAQAIYLRSRGVRNVQGFLFSKAVPADKYVAIVNSLNGGGGAPFPGETLGEAEDCAQSVAA